ncbi:bifunctional glycosyltransferase/CDP-glycerol:glycerophosphate glycerophosphotransferase [Chromohalobacter israelensis]|uniref:bifunctional glycosyltransferase/CDP-glycerol:glycerophosphate glycerophosphotransferase n=1 Tax=Chromohalobacter israelensis TaxID=141390 RepID=UPI00265B8AFD|nr:glycosyltransferase [Chromohalobacter salexigens]MDO0946708.1 CDP-glycerol glycerophosphotransferase family protein [Chromohalobacter salexigens]
MIESKIPVSVIIPVFNTEAYLPECIESVLQQSLDKVEILIVDDGSTDRSLEIARDFEKRHSNVLVFQQERKRQGAARNLALQHASGRYVSFLDSDDTLPVDSLRRMVDAADRYGSDMVCGIQQSFSQWRNWVGVPVHKREFNRLIERTTINEMPTLIQDISACNRLISRETIEKHGMRFPEGTAGEDLDFMARLYLHCDVITVLPEVVYNYRGRNDSRTSRISSQFFEDRVAVTEGLEQSFTEKCAQNIYQRLLRSEVRKLVGNRFLKVVKSSPYDEQLEIFGIIGRLVKRLSSEDMRSTEDFSLLQQIRIIMLSGKEYDALVAYENSPRSPRYLDLIKSESIKAQLFEPMMRMQFQGLARYERIQQAQNTRVFALASRIALKAARFLRMTSKIKVIPMFKYFAAAPVAKLAAKLNLDKTIWLMDERVARSAEDNGYFFFKYLRENHPKLPVFFILSRHSPHWNIVAPLGNVVAQYSWKHAYLLWRAQVMISTDSFRGLDFPSEALPRLRRKTLNVFLQHGVTGNKTTTYTRDNYPYFTQVIVSNGIEQACYRNSYGFAPSQVKLTGIPRLDALPTQCTGERSRKILVAPTWRRWLKGQNEIQASRYYYAWNRFITSPRLAEILEQHQMELYFRPHFNMMHFIGEFEKSSPRVHVIRDLDEPLHNLIREADLLVTDYSSVMYDFFYQEKPVLGYMFDRLEWEMQPPGPPHLDYERDLALELVTTEEDLLERLQECLEYGCKMSEEKRERLPKLFTFRDGKNCERIYQAVTDELSKS